MGEFVNHDEYGPYICFNANVGQVMGRLATTTMFTFDFEDKGVDHIFVALEDEEDSFTGPYLFRIAFDEQPGMFDRILTEMRDEGFGEVSAEKPHESDQAVFDHFVDQVFAKKVTNKKIKRWLNA